MRSSLRATNILPQSLFRPPPLSKPSSIPLIGSSSRIPTEPGCSRWFSCSRCSARHPSDQTFFTANKTSHDEPLPSSLSHDPRPHKSLHLPLPPTLPYSPDSHPFKRHAEALALSIVSASPRESWTVFDALHPSLRRYIPDRTFRDLLSHQLKEPGAFVKLRRLRSLLALAKECGMPWSDLGRANLVECLRVELSCALSAKSPKIRGSIAETEALWEEVARLSPDGLGGLPLDVRKNWLRLQRRLGATNPGRRETAAQALLRLADAGGAQGIGSIASKIIRFCPPQQRLQLAALCAEHSMDLDTFALARGAFESALAKGTDITILQAEVDRIRKTLSRTTADSLQQSLTQALLSVQSPAKALASTPNDTSTPRLTRLAISAIKRLSSDSIARDMPEVHRKLEILLDRPDTDVDGLIQHWFDALHRLPQQAIHFLPTLRKLYDSHRLETLSPVRIWQALQAIVAVLPDEQAYILSRKLYPLARSTVDHIRWNHANVELWQKLFHHALSGTQKQVHFASRLYADLLADGMRVRRVDSLSLIRGIGGMRSASRPILLERHISDHLWATFGSRTAFVDALVGGLTSTSNPADAALAFDLSVRLLQGKPLPITAAERITASLSQSRRPFHQRVCMQVLKHLSPEADARKCFDHCLYSIIVHRDTSRQMDQSIRLGKAINLYRAMLARHTSPMPRSISLLVRILLHAGYLDHALSVFHAATAAGIVLKSNATSRLMIHLAINGRVDDGEEVERAWRAVAPPNVYDKGVIGARLVLDAKAGKPQDMEATSRLLNWRATTYFTRFLQSLQTHEVDATVEPVVSSPSRPSVSAGDDESRGPDEIRVRNEEPGMDVPAVSPAKVTRTGWWSSTTSPSSTGKGSGVNLASRVAGVGM